MTTTVVIETARTKPKTAGQIIFDKMFSVRMSVVDAMDENDVHSRGMFTTGYADIDAQAAKRPTVVWRTIAEMVELWHDGVAMELVNGMVDAEKINKIIQEHLADCTRWHQSQQYGLRREDPSVTQQRLEDLRKMDEFARQIYNKVRQHGKDDNVTGLAKVIKSAAPAIGLDPFGQKAVVSKRSAADYIPIEERIDYDVLKKRKRYRS
ncbi:hypothetical protein MOA67_gp169 [Klebsiella phage KpLz-2_45]|uniref:hypothetical protein n=1 Tax=Klebsiella phage KpLz-2_45 TaxID=2698923 RepID=UPI001F1302A0|nr:hypothetical protein MOA67_gp169 [Klebsiella phage KpLz-2_45]UKS72035.1 hypothetical protein KpLz245_1690 [Klebsiella phage KpLz-2_45]